jgi:hypothetical protein
MSTSALRSSTLRCLFSPVLIAFSILIFSGAVFADSHARIVRLSYIDGDVEIDKGDGHGFDTAYLNMPITYQSKVWARDGQAEIEMEDGSSIRLTPETLVSFSDLSLGSDGARTTSVELQDGTAYFHIRQHDPDRFNLSFGNNQVQLLTPAHFRVDTTKRQFELAVFKGEVQVSSSGGPEVAVKGGETIRLDSDDPDRYYLAKGIDVENYDDWDKDRTNSHDQVVSTASDNGSNALIYGLSDLSTYGNYFYVPGYGYMWRPNSASLGWDPFADGYWMSYPGYGYMFVSGYPWGWAPYRYGSWDYVNGYGWCWAPGNTWNTWYPIPPLRNAPPHFRPPHPPRVAGPAVLAVNNGTVVPVPRHRPVFDNDSLAHVRPHAGKIEAANGTVVQRGQPGVVPAQGFVSNTNHSSTPAGTAPGFVAMEPSRQINTPAATVTVPMPPVRSVSATPNHAPSPSPRMEPHVSAAPMHTASPAMSSAPRSSSPSFSGGGMRMSSPSMGGGGGHAGGGGGGGHSSGGSSGGGHR